MELKSGMTKPEEFDSSILLFTEPLVIWPDWDCPGGMGVASLGLLELGKEGAAGQSAQTGSFMNKLSNWGHHR